jgi:hypothetical protein
MDGLKPTEVAGGAPFRIVAGGGGVGECPALGEGDEPHAIEVAAILDIEDAAIGEQSLAHLGRLRCQGDGKGSEPGEEGAAAHGQ